MAGNLEDSIRFIEGLIENQSTDLNNIIIEAGSKDDRVERKIKGNQVVYLVPKEYKETLNIKKRGELAARKLRENILRKEKGAALDRGNRDIDSIFEGRYRKEAVETYSNVLEPTTKQIVEKKRRAKKRNIKNKPNKRKFLAIAGVGLTMLSAAIAINKVINEYNVANAATVEYNTYDDEKSAEEILKSKISSELGIDEQDISFSTAQIDSKTTVVKLRLGDKEYRNVDDHSNIITDDTKSLEGKISKLILKTKNKDTKTAIKDVKKFDEEYTVVETKDGRVVTESRPADEHEER